jgi:hypothetical protein
MMYMCTDLHAIQCDQPPLICFCVCEHKANILLLSFSNDDVRSRDGSTTFKM